jgi:hypothetical protein
MSVISFLNDLGIISNEGTGLENNQGLLQGQKYMEYGRIYNNSVNNNLTLLQEPLTPGIGSITDVLEDTKTLKEDNISSTREMSHNDNENEFNKTLSKYSVIYNNLSEELIQKKKDNKDNNKINKNVLKELNIINNKLISLSKKIGDEVSSLKTNDILLQNQIKEKQKELQNYISSINNENKDYENTINGQEETTHLNLVSNYYFYLFWIFISIIIIGVTIKISINDNNNTLINFTFVFMLIGVYLLLKN